MKHAESYEAPEIAILVDVSMESCILAGSSLENLSDGGEWSWDN